MTNTLRERRKQQLRDEILDAARNLVAEKGYATTSMDDLAAVVGISKPTLYSHFPTKEALIAASVVREFDRLIAITLSEESAATPLQRLSLILETAARKQAQDGQIMVQIGMPDIHQVICNFPEAIERFQRLDEAINSLVRDAIEHGEIDPTLDQATVVRGFYALLAALHPRLEHAGRTPGIEAPATLARIFARGVSPSGTPR